MNVKVLSLSILGFCIFSKVCSIYWIFLICSCFAVAILAIISVLIAIAPNHSTETGIRNPLSEQHHVQTKLGIDFERIIHPLSGSPSHASHHSSDRMTGNPQIDNILSSLLDYIFRDFIDSWYSQLTNNKEFTTETREAIEKIIANVTKRLQQAPLLTLITTKMVDDVAAHAKLYHQANKTLTEQSTMKKTQPPSKFNSPFHRRNKSDTDVNSRNWNLGNALIHRKVANSTFYSVQTDEKLLDPEKQLIEIFFESCGNLYKDESISEEALEKHLIAVMETFLYFTLEPEDFRCDTIRSFLSSLLASVVGKSVISMLADPDFINFQIAQQFANDPPLAEHLIKMIRQCNDLSELRAVRHLITREMDSKHRDPKFTGQLASLNYTQKIIDMRITSISNRNADSKQYEKEKVSLKFPQLSLDEILSKDLALSYYLDYLSILNLQKYVIFYILAQEWKLTTNQRLLENLEEVRRQQMLRHVRDTAFNLYREYLIPSSANYLNIDHGLIEVLHIKIKDTYIQPEPSWFESICKFVYEKLKNEHVFLQNFYESPAYKKLLEELEETESETSIDLPLSDIKSETSDNSDDEIDLLEPDWDPNMTRHQRSHSDTGILLSRETQNIIEQRLTANIINTAVLTNGNFAVYAIHVKLLDKDYGVEHIKSWHIYRRYSKFLEMKKDLLRKFPLLQHAALPFPKKQTFHNTNRQLIERRMVILNEFLKVICEKAEHDNNMHRVILAFLEPDQDDRDHGTKVIKSLVNPLKYGMRTIKNMPDNVIGGFSRIFLHKNIDKVGGISDMIDAQQSNTEFPALVSFLNLLNVVFDLESRSQWLKKGILSLVAAPFISQSVNKKIQEIAQKMILDPERIEGVLCGILNNVWPNGVKQESLKREDMTKLRTRMAAKVALFAFLTDDLKHFLGSETTRVGLTNFFEMLQNPTLNKRLVLVLMHRLCTTIFPTSSMTKHVINK